MDPTMVCMAHRRWGVLHTMGFGHVAVFQVCDWCCYEVAMCWSNICGETSIGADRLHHTMKMKTGMNGHLMDHNGQSRAHHILNGSHQELKVQVKSHLGHQNGESQISKN